MFLSFSYRRRRALHRLLHGISFFGAKIRKKRETYARYLEKYREGLQNSYYKLLCGEGVRNLNVQLSNNPKAGWGFDAE